MLGAATNNMRLQFDTENLTLADAVGMAGGLRDLQAEPSGVFVFRMEPAALVQGMKKGVTTTGGMVPVIFQADMRAPQAFFLAQSFQMQDKDIVYVANAESTQLDKLIVKLLHAAEIANIAIRSSTNNVSVAGP